MPRRSLEDDVVDEETRLLPPLTESTSAPAGGEQAASVEPDSKVTFLRGFCISISLGALIFLQSMLSPVLYPHYTDIMLFSIQHIPPYHDTIIPCRRSQCVRQRQLVCFGISCMMDLNTTSTHD